MAKALKNRASKLSYSSPGQGIIPGFESPFSRHLNPSNRWVILSNKIPWDELVNIYNKQMRNSQTGAEGINGRVVIGAVIIKHMCDLSDRETLQQIQENMYMQYFIGFNSFCDEEPFDASLFVEFRKRLGVDQINAINEKILHLSQQTASSTKRKDDNTPPDAPGKSGEQVVSQAPVNDEVSITHQGKLIVDATACPQDISYPTDLNLLNSAREKAEELLDFLYVPEIHASKPRTYREVARKMYLKVAQKKVKTKVEIRRSIKAQLTPGQDKDYVVPIEKATTYFTT